MSMMTLRFKGMCCLVDGRTADPFTKRVVLPRDQQHETTNDAPHVPYVEVESDDVLPGMGPTPSKTYSRGEGGVARSFSRFDLDGERVLIRNAAQGNGLLVVPTYDERVPKMTLVCPDCPPNPRPECFSAIPPADKVAAYFDIFSGYLNAGPVELQETAFDPGTQWPPQRLAHWAQLDLAIHGDRPEIVMQKFDGSNERIIPLRRGAGAVTIGNGREEDIEELSMESNRRDHFQMYYDLGDGLPDLQPLPMVPMSAIRACAPVNWP